MHYIYKKIKGYTYFIKEIKKKYKKRLIQTYSYHKLTLCFTYYN